MSEADDAFEELLSRVRGEYLEMPGLHLTVAQAARLWGLDVAECEALLSFLVASGFLRRTPAGAFALAAGENGRSRPNGAWLQKRTNARAIGRMPHGGGGRVTARLDKHG